VTGAERDWNLKAQLEAIVDGDYGNMQWRIDKIMGLIRSEMERVRQEYIALLKSVDPFSGGRDSDMCLWCQRAARSIYRFEQNFDPEYHYANCDLIRALADRS